LFLGRGWHGHVNQRRGLPGRPNCENCGVAEVTADPASTTGVYAYALDSARAQAL